MIDLLKKEYAQIYSKHDIRSIYPAEFLVRMFKGNYPKLNLCLQKNNTQSILEVGCGDGRNLPLFKDVGLTTYGVEISDEICNHVTSELEKINLSDILVKTGTTQSIPFEDNFFDYVVSWNACYYMENSENLDFQRHVHELSRILKSNGILILSIPMQNHSTFEGSITIKKGYKLIQNDPHHIRNGNIFRYFSDTNEIEQEFSTFFKNFLFASERADHFGIHNYSHIIVCTKK